jgi:hypothetical protein
VRTAFVSALGVLALLFIVGGPFADVPELINFQGILLDSNGDPITTPTSVTFSIWNDPTAGDSLWSETQTMTPDDEARFNVLLGGVSPVPDSALADTGAYLEVTVETGPPMSPRSKLVTVPYAYRVGTVDGASGGTIEGDVNIQGDVYLTGDTILVGQIQIEPTTRHFNILPEDFVVSEFGGSAPISTLHLPHGSILTKIVIYGGQGASVYRMDMINRAYEVIGTVTTASDSTTISSFSYPTIDNIHYMYFLQIPGDVLGDSSPYGIRVEYVIESPLP